MLIRFLGTGASLGTPVLGCTCDVCSSADPRDHRLRSSLLIQQNGENILIDSGPDFRQQLLHLGTAHIDSFLYTHGHHDHIGGMDETRAVFYAMDKQPLQFFCEEFTAAKIKKYYDYLFGPIEGEKYHGRPRADFHIIRPGETFLTAKGRKVLPLRAWHGSMPVTAYKIGRLVYMTDVKTVPEETKREIDKNTVLILGALHRKPHPLHFNLEEALEFVREVNPAHAYLIHVSHYMGKYEEVSKELPAHVSLSYDGLEIEID